ncbi:helix-turn-helix domain-containing protein [Brevundimonas sp.]|uniref:helix-turn-helix domain-containing protein n=1 Tax=Brevundimonas sp. TaxID=1871086 RepID=UPI0039C857AF
MIGDPGNQASSPAVRSRATLRTDRRRACATSSCKRSCLSDLERGVRNPSVRALGRLATALNVPPSKLLQIDWQRTLYAR